MTASLARSDKAAALRPPLAVDLDGTLILSDTLHEGVVSLLKHAPSKVLALARWLPAGRAAVKRRVAASTGFDPAALPYDPALLAYLRAEQAAGRRIGLFTAADQSIAEAVAAHLGCFDLARGSDGVTNLRGAAKAAAILAAFGPEFAYAGDSMTDLPVFARAASAILTGPQVERLRQRLDAGAVIEATFPRERSGLGTWLRALRLRHWTKNAMVVVPPLLGNQGVSPLAVLLLFVLFGTLASATYLLNDLADLAADRTHPVKRLRPLASGAIKVGDAAMLAVAMIVATLLASLALPVGCQLVMAAYLVLTLLYSSALKRMPMIDVSVLAGLFTLRVLAGSMLVSTTVSPWLLTFAMLFFLGLAAIKRYTELQRLLAESRHGINARGYSAQDMPILLATGISTGISAIVIFMVYLINEQYPRAVYAHPEALWGIMPVLLVWTLRLWHLAVHGRMSEDPVLFALRDRVSLALGSVILLVMLAARW